MVWVQGVAASTFYGIDCGGEIEAGAAVWPELKAPYLSRHEDPYCAHSLWKSAIRKDDLRKALLAWGIRTGPLDVLTVTGRTTSGRALRLQAGGMSAFRVVGSRLPSERALGWSRIP